jgi:deoxyribodipyrimidine photo-lyase
MRTAIVLFTRDLRVHDHAALTAALAAAERVVPLFVLDERLLGASPRRTDFLFESLAALDAALLERGGRLVLRRGDPVAETARLAGEVGAKAVFLSADVSAYAARRERLLAERLDVRGFPGATVVPPGVLAPAGRDHYRVFTPYWNAWRLMPLREPFPAPRLVPVPDGIASEPLSGTEAGGEAKGRRRLEHWLAHGLVRYPERQNLAADGTSRLSPYLHLGCVSPLEPVRRCLGRPEAEPFVRQLCWRDFYAQLLAANPRLPADDYRPRGDDWADDAGGLAAWKEGLTGYPLVDAGMRQLAAEGWLPARARLVAASFLVKDLRIDWRDGAAHFARLLVDGDLASNVGNWQWVAGTGTDTRPNRVFNPVAQARRFDPTGDYVRRWVPELAAVDGLAVHEPWRLGRLRPSGYPDRIVEHDAAAAAFLAGRR